MRKFYLALLSIASISVAQAQELITDRPDQTESPLAVPAGALQIEAGYLAAFNESGTTTLRNQQAPNALFRLGLTHWAELRLVTQYETFRTADTTFRGLGDWQIGAKFELLNNPKRNVVVGMFTHVLVPNGNEGLSSDEWGLDHRFSISHQWGAVGIGYNFGYIHTGSGNGDVPYTLSLAVELTDELGVFVEPYGTYSNLEDWDHSINAGLVYLIAPRLQADFSIGTGLSERSNFISFGLSTIVGPH